jgi:hypothetical protein
MSDAYNVRSNGQRYYVYRMDGNVQVAEFTVTALPKPSAMPLFEICAITSSSVKKKSQSQKLLRDGWVEDSELTRRVSFHRHPAAAGIPSRPAIKAKKSQVPDPPPGQGASY